MNKKLHKILQASIGLAVFLAVQAGGHTLFIKADSFFVEPGRDVAIPVINGTFETAEARIQPGRMQDARIVGPDGKESAIDDGQWSFSGRVTKLAASFEQPGNHVIGIATRAAIARITPENFNFYLRYEGLDDEDKERQALEETDIAAAERYQKYAKAIIQVGTETTDNFDAVFGYPVEIVPLVNPYELTRGDTFRARILRDGEPLANELIYATHEGHYDMSPEGIFDELVKVRSDENGEIEFALEEAGRWYVRFIDLERTGDQEHWYSGMLVAVGAEEPRIPYRSDWATLTFEIR
jgi:uncharacterized GH25 family protein